MVQNAQKACEAHLTCNLGEYCEPGDLCWAPFVHRIHHNGLWEDFLLLHHTPSSGDSGCFFPLWIDLIEKPVKITRFSQIEKVGLRLRQLIEQYFSVRRIEINYKPAITPRLFHSDESLISNNTESFEQAFK